MTLDDMMNEYITARIRTYIADNLHSIMTEWFARYNVQPNSLAQEGINEVVAQYLSDNDYMTRDDVKEEINGADVRIGSVYLSA